MTLTAPDPVASGKVFEVLAVHGRTPRTLDDFIDDAVFTLHWDELDRLVTGQGRREGDSVRFTEKDNEHGGKDVRVWSIATSQHDGSFVAHTDR